MHGGQRSNIAQGLAGLMVGNCEPSKIVDDLHSGRREFLSSMVCSHSAGPHPARTRLGLVKAHGLLLRARATCQWSSLDCR